ncbi:MAG: RsmE family RNA methyltransferase [Spirochaetes bacterium]|nr:RsmE family RNA methyltransferase [Spirochaetota bacterium]
MNLLILSDEELADGLPRHDRRVEHVRKILKKGPGDPVHAGTTDGTIGTATILSFDGKTMRFAYSPEREAPPLRPVTLVLGFPRPIQADRILRELASLGVERIFLCGSDLGEKSYLDSGRYRDGDFRRPLVEGAEQAGNPRLPGVATFPSLDSALEALGSSCPARIAFDPHRERSAFGAMTLDSAPVALAIGSERGWTGRELGLLEARGFSIRTLGDRIMRTETAAVAATALALARLGYL